MSRRDRKGPSGYYYYYAAGKPISLTLDEEWMAVDKQRLAEAGAGRAVEKAVRDSSRPLRGDLVLVRCDALTGEQRDALAQRGASHPVFHAEGATLVALPEVRVEDSSPRRQAALHDWLRQHTGEAEVVEDRGDRIVLRPTSGRGLDALTLANHLGEQVRPEMAQPRFLRIAERPEA
jgi:hypothetical protein